METNKRIKRAMRDEMRRQSLTQKALADRLGVKQPTVAGLLSDDGAKVPESLVNALEALGLELVVREKG